MSLIICDNGPSGRPLLITSHCRTTGCRGVVVHTPSDPPSEILCERHYIPPGRTKPLSRRERQRQAQAQARQPR